jgi:hypothetical protein
MAINPVSSSNAAVTATQAVRPQQQVASPSQPAGNDHDGDDAVQATQSTPPKPTINTSGQTVGTLVNVTA